MQPWPRVLLSISTTSTSAPVYPTHTVYPITHDGAEDPSFSHQQTLVNNAKTECYESVREFIQFIYFPELIC